MKKIFYILFIPLFIASCNHTKQTQSVIEQVEPVTYPVGYIAQSINTDLNDKSELFPLQDEFLENFLQVFTKYEGLKPIMATEFPNEWGVMLVERLPEGRELYQIQSLNREWIYLVITSGFGTQRILDLLPVAIDLADQKQDVLETEIWKTEREVDGIFSVTKSYEWKRSLEEVTQKEYEADKESGKKKKRQPKLVVLCEIVAAVTLILLVMNFTGLSTVLKGEDKAKIRIHNVSKMANDSEISVYIYDNTMQEIEFFKIERETWAEVPLYANSYLVKIVDAGGAEYFYPPTKEPCPMSGKFVLRYDGKDLMRD